MAKTVTLSSVRINLAVMDLTLQALWIRFSILDENDILIRDDDAVFFSNQIPDPSTTFRNFPPIPAEKWYLLPTDGTLALATLNSEVMVGLSVLIN